MQSWEEAAGEWNSEGNILELPRVKFGGLPPRDGVKAFHEVKNLFFHGVVLKGNGNKL